MAKFRHLEMAVMCQSYMYEEVKSTLHLRNIVTRRVKAAIPPPAERSFAYQFSRVSDTEPLHSRGNKYTGDRYIENVKQNCSRRCLLPQPPSSNKRGAVDKPSVQKCRSEDSTWKK
jgi:hypothetical protein